MTPNLDLQTLYRNILHVLEHGLRTATYKLATLMAIVDFCVDQPPLQAGSTPNVPLAELARRVMTLYWRQSQPFEGTHLLQSTQSRSRILDSLNAVRAAAGPTNADLTLDDAAQSAPEVFRRALDNVALCLAQQPLPRLQRLPGSAKSITFLYDDSFLHDNVTRSELQRHNNAIQLYSGVAEGLSALQVPLQRALRSMWVDDIIRINRLLQQKRRELQEHLFGECLPNDSDSEIQSVRDLVSETESHAPRNAGLATSKFAARLNYLFETVRSPEGQPYSSGEVAAKIRQSGFAPMTVSEVSRLRAGVGQAPPKRTVKALSRFFGVTPGYFFGDEDPRSAPVVAQQTWPGQLAHKNISLGSALSQANESELSQLSRIGKHSSPTMDSSRDRGTHTENQDAGRPVVGADLNEVASQCAMPGNGCWLAPSNSPVRCRPPNDRRASMNLPRMPLHRWAWMIANGHSEDSIPAHVLHVRRRCTGDTCCNPSHLYAAAPGRAEKLSASAVAALLQKPLAASLRQPLSASDLCGKSSGRSGTVLTDDLGSIAGYCIHDDSDCWITPTLNPVSCRASGDLRRDTELPKMRPHRWAWMVANGRASNPLPGNLFQVWRHCGRANCCNPKHLYLIDPDGEESSAEEADEYLRYLAMNQPDTLDSDLHSQSGDVDTRTPPNTLTRYGDPAGGRHRAAIHGGEGSGPIELRAVGSPEAMDLFAERLNKLFESRRGPTGNPLTASDVAAALQDDGLAVSESVISRLQTASGALPTAATTEALAYFFNVDVDYFSAGTHSTTVRDPRPTDHAHPEVRLHPQPTVRPSESRSQLQVIGTSVAELGRVVAGLSQIASECLARDPADIEHSRRLLLLIADLGALLNTPMQNRVISRPLVRRIVAEWTAAHSARSAKDPMLSRLKQLLDEVSKTDEFR